MKARISIRENASRLWNVSGVYRRKNTYNTYNDTVLYYDWVNIIPLGELRVIYAVGERAKINEICARRQN